MPLPGRDVAVIVGVFKAALQGVVVDVGHALFGLDPVDAHGFKFQIGHGAGGVLGERLVNPQGDFAAGNHFTLHQMCLDDLLCDGQSHNYIPLSIIADMACPTCSFISFSA